MASSYPSYSYDTNTQSSHLSHSRRTILAVILLLFAGLIFTRLIYCQVPTTVDLKEYTKIVYDGYNSKGTAKIQMDWDNLAQKLTKIMNQKSSFLPMGDKYDPASLYQSCPEIQNAIHVSISPNHNLSNGAITTVSYDLNNKLIKKDKIRFKGVSYQDKAQGFSNVETINPFQHIEIVFTQSQKGGIKASYIRTSPDTLTQNLTFFFANGNSDTSISTKKGQTVYLKVRTDDNGKPLLPQEDWNHYQVTQPSLSKTCQAITSYCQTMNDVPEICLEQIKQESEKNLQTYYSQHDDFATFSDWKYEGIYFLSHHKTHQNRIFVVYSTTVSSTAQEGEEGYFEPFTLYTYSQYQNQAITDEGHRIRIQKDGAVSQKDKLRIPNRAVKIGKDRTILGYQGKKGAQKMYQSIILKNAKQYSSQMSQALTQYQPNKKVAK